MSLYTRARKHIDMDRVKELREEKIKREQIAKLVQEQEKIRAELEYIEAEESKYINWRSELEEGMNTSGMGMINLPAQGDVDIVDSDTAFATLSGQHGTVSAGTVIVTDGGSNDINNGTHTAYRVARFTVDGTKSTHVKITISKGGGTSSWTDREESWDDGVTLNISDADNFFAPGYYDGNLSSGTHIIALPGKYKNTRISFEQFAKLASEGSSGTTGALRITNVSVQRRTPVNVFVSLDDPDSSAFVRDGDFDRLSNAEKKKKLEEQLRSGDEYLNKMFGEGMPKGATTIADYEPQQSFMDIQAGGERITKQGGKTVTDTTRGIKDGKIDGKPIRSSTPTSKSVPFTGLSPEDLKSISDRVGGSYSGTTSQPDKQPVKGVPFTGLSPEDLKSISDRVGGSYSGKTNPTNTLSYPPKSSDNKAALEKNIKASLKQLEVDNEQLKGDALKRNIGLAVDLGLDILTVVTMLTPIPGDEAAAIAVQASKAGVKTGAKTMAQQRTIDAFRTQVTDPKNLSRAQEVLSRTPAKFKKDVAIQIKVQGKTINVKANEILRNKGFKVDSYQPQGKVLSEKKRLKSPKSLADKIPGYYDGKPSPLGFPVEEPPKMKNGFHPDLVDGKKVANRFNRLDPQSAKAMPKTGNPHIDKKVRAAAKKPK